jgi:HSP20 family protein
MDFIKNNLIGEIKIMQQRAEEMMKELLGDRRAIGPIEHHSWTPSVDIYETDVDIIILAELAGVRKEDVSIMLDRDMICIAGTRHSSDMKDRIRQHQMEISFGPFKRIFRISVPIRCEEVEATFQDGFLTVRMPKQAPVPVKIHVDA